MRKRLRLKSVDLAQHTHLPPGTKQHGEDDRASGRGAADATLAVNEDSAVAPLHLAGETNQPFNIALRGTTVRLEQPVLELQPQTAWRFVPPRGRTLTWIANGDNVSELGAPTR